MKILFIEDDAIECMKMKRTVSKSGVTHQIVEAKNGEEALEYLQSANPLPDIVLLDLNMPKMNGVEFLEILKRDDRLRFLPTIILTTSQNRNDLLSCYKLGVAGYLIKPLKYEDYEDKINKLLAYWEINEFVKN